MEKRDKNWELSTSAGGAATMELRGDWLQPAPLEPELDGVSSLSFDTGRLGKWNTFLAASLFNLLAVCGRRGIRVDLSALPAGLRQLLNLATAAPVQPEHASAKPSFLERTGDATLSIFNSCVTGCQFIGELTLSLMRLILGRARMRWCDLFSEIYKAGPSAFFIVSLISFLMGVILAFVGSIPLRWFNVELYVSSLIGIGMCRMMGAVMTGVVMAGRTGASYAAELGTMQTNDEIDALSSMGISPMEFLVLPRFLALTLMMPLLGVFSFCSGILGGLSVGVVYLELSPLEFWTNLVKTTRVNDLYVGLFTSLVYGILIAICGCLRGLTCGHSSEAVGRATTSAMVSSIICMVISTFVITVLTVFLEI